MVIIHKQNIVDNTYQLEIPFKYNVWRWFDMKPEPLKNKGHLVGILKVYKPSEIKSAVEWLKDRSNDFATMLLDEEYKRFVNIIDEAFEDVRDKE